MFDKEKPEALSDRASAALDKVVDELGLCHRTVNMLKMAQITTVRALVGYEEIDLLEYRNCGRKTLTELREVLEEVDLRLGMKLAK